jgi:hypothetical protein
VTSIGDTVTDFDITIVNMHSCVAPANAGSSACGANSYMSHVYPVCCLSQHEGIWGSGCTYQSFFASVLVGDEWSASRPNRFSLGKRAPHARWIGGWVGPRAGLDDVE